MPQRINWEPGNSVGNATLDAQHQALLARCNLLADCLAIGGAAGERRFDEAFAELLALARQHFSTEETLLAQSGHAGLDVYRDECAEFDYLADDIITTENFDRDELQTFLALWWTGHILDAAKNHRACLEQP
ncbi:MAG: hemerythrin family protein [Zoogloeaceae bacterium]|jgi:hemerythrin-like metal-binding protein|nr:hemerythrin family protein [Zoogloeaceae bacterium]